MEQLQNFLESNDLGEYFDAITNQLKMKSVSKLKFISEDDLLQIGMSRPQIKMLFDCYRKEQSPFGKIRRIFGPGRAKTKGNSALVSAVSAANSESTVSASNSSVAPQSSTSSATHSNGTSNSSGTFSSTSSATVTHTTPCATGNIVAPCK